METKKMTTLNRKLNRLNKIGFTITFFKPHLTNADCIECPINDELARYLLLTNSFEHAELRQFGVFYEKISCARDFRRVIAHLNIKEKELENREM